MRSKPFWSVIIPSYNSSPRLVEITKKLIECSMTVDEGGEILVIDDNSTNNFDYSSLEKSSLPVKIIHNSRNLGQCKSENIGASKALGELLIFLDDDCVPANNVFISKIIKAYQRGKQVIVGSIITGATNSSVENVRFPLVNDEIDKVVEANGLQGGCFAINKNIFLKIGGFSEDLAYFYDIDLGYKIIKAGYDIYNYKEVSVIHLDNKISLTQELNKTYNAYKTSYQTLVKRYPKSKKSFFWGSTLSARDIIFDKIVFHNYIFKLIFRIYKNIFSYIPRSISLEIYNYLHRCVIYYAVKGLEFK